MILGAIFAGGQARRFGSDKALAIVDGVAMIARVAAALQPQVDRLAVVGRVWGDLPVIEDRPLPGLGPLGALAGALAFGEENGFDAVLTSGCDLPDLPPKLTDLLAPGPSVVTGQPLVGLWPTRLAKRLLRHLETTQDRSMRGWIAVAGARSVPLDRALANINTPAELEDFLRPAPADPRSSR